jgi:hypothetical protein
MMRPGGSLLCVAVVVSATCVGCATAQRPSRGLIATDQGGAVGYQHRFERSRFVTGPSGAQLRRLEEHGFAKVVGPEGVFATDLRNGLVVAVRSGGSNKGEANSAEAAAKSGYLSDPVKHNEQGAAPRSYCRARIWMAAWKPVR